MKRRVKVPPNRFWIASRFFPYLGGKHFLVKHLLRLVPPHKVYVEVFGGAAALLFAKERSPHEVYNDLDSNLYNLFIVVRDRRKEFVKKLEWVPYSRELYQRWTKDLDAGRILDPVERAVAFCYCMRAAFSGRWRAGWAFSRSGSDRAKIWAKFPEAVESIAERISAVNVDHKDFRACIKTWDTSETFFFLDPPYLDTLQARTVISFTEQDHKDLAEILSHIKGKWLLTYNDHPLIRRLYDDSKFIVRRIRCQLASRKWGQGPRRAALVNLVIRNYDL